MERTVNTKFYHFNQNNSGGYFVQNEQYGIGEDVIIEAQNYNEAWGKLQSIGENVDGFNRYCGCCGERWSNWPEEGDSIPSIYGTAIEENEKGWFRDKCYVHYYDGTFKRHDFKEPAS